MQDYFLFSDVCYSHQRYFLPEVPLYASQASLIEHQLRGDGPGHAFKGHPKCGFCGTLHYSTDELYEHCRDRHECCFICEKHFQKRYVYFKNYDELERHFAKDHFLCKDKMCLEKKFVVFPTELDIKEHQMSCHRTKGQRSSQRTAMSIQIDLQTGIVQPQSQPSKKPSSEAFRPRKAGSDATAAATGAARPISPPSEDFLSFSAPVVEIQRENPKSLSFGTQRFPSLDTTAKAPQPSMAYRQHSNLTPDHFPSLVSRDAVSGTTTTASGASRPSYNQMAQSIQRPGPIQPTAMTGLGLGLGMRSMDQDYPALAMAAPSLTNIQPSLSSPSTPPSLIPSNAAHVKKQKSKITYRIA